MAKTHLPTAAAVLPVLYLVGCGGDAGTGPVPDPVPSAITSVVGAIAAVPRSTREIRVRVLDAGGRGVPGVPVTFEIPPGHGYLSIDRLSVVASDDSGTATELWFLPDAPGTFDLEIRASHGGSPLGGSPIVISAELESFSPAVDEMLVGLSQYIDFALARNRESLGPNSQIAGFIRGKIAVTENANLASAIVAGRRFSTTTMPSADGRDLDVTSVFPLDTLRNGAEGQAAQLGPALAVLEGFLGVSAPFDRAQLWYGFVIGASGGGGGLHMEDRGTYLARSHLIPAPLPYDAIVYHELAHSWIGHESLTQYLELLVFNILTTGSPDISLWIHKRQYAGPSDANTGVHALLDIHEMIGHEAMGRAYRKIYDLRPYYGQPLSPAVLQAFVDEASPAQQAAVTAKADKIGF